MTTRSLFRPVDALYYISALILLLFVSIINISGQETAAKGEMRVRYISSAPESTSAAAPFDEKPGIRFVKRPESSEGGSKQKNLESDDYELEKTTFNFINDKRAEIGLAKLTWSDETAKLAREHSQNMARNDFFSHIGLNGRMVDQRAIDFGLDGWKSIGENIAFCQGFSNPEEFVVQRWMLSDGHRKNLLNKMWKESGIGIAKTDEGKYYFTQIFIMN
ncbi:MAG: CAP domain-containing protein [Pyrinomonadaceae bacterium]